MQECRQKGDCLHGHIEISREYGDPIPEPSTQEEVKAMEDVKDAEAFFVIHVPDVKEET